MTRTAQNSRCRAGARDRIHPLVDADQRGEHEKPLRDGRAEHCGDECERAGEGEQNSFQLPVPAPRRRRPSRSGTSAGARQPSRTAAPSSGTAHTRRPRSRSPRSHRQPQARRSPQSNALRARPSSTPSNRDPVTSQQLCSSSCRQHDSTLEHLINYTTNHLCYCAFVHDVKACARSPIHGADHSANASREPQEDQ